MRTVFPAALLAGIFIAAPVSGHLPDTAPACPATVAPKGALAAWTGPVALMAVGDQRHLSRAGLAVGRAANVRLLQTSQVRYPSRPEKPGSAASYGGLAQISVRTAGTYRIALGSAAWIDVVAQGKALTSVAHAHGPDCTGIRKMVDFSLTPGRYTLQIAASGTPKITVLVARLR